MPPPRDEFPCTIFTKLDVKRKSHVHPRAKFNHRSFRNSAARVVSGTRKFDRGMRQLVHTELHWLDVPERVKYKLGVITRQRLYGSAPRYLASCCVPVSTTASRHLRSALSAGDTVSPAYNIWSSGLFSSRSDVLKLTAQKLA